jgi:hypothetical protein
VVTSKEAETCSGCFWSNMRKTDPRPKVYDKEVQEEIITKTNLLLKL